LELFLSKWMYPNLLKPVFVRTFPNPSRRTGRLF
jgi:hypothetical protein